MSRSAATSPFDSCSLSDPEPELEDVGHLLRLESPQDHL